MSANGGNIRMPENIFSIEAVKREQEQARLQQVVATKKTEKKVPMNITLSIEHKKKLIEYARKKHLSASVLIQMWIDSL